MRNRQNQNYRTAVDLLFANVGQGSYNLAGTALLEHMQ